MTWIFGGPYQGKTFLANALREKGIEVTEFDELFDELNVDGVDKKAWRAEHPDHSRWQKVWKLATEAMNERHKRGGIVVSHDPFPGDTRHVLHLWPGLAEVKKRMAKSKDKSRLAAHAHWFDKAKKRDWFLIYPTRSFDDLVRDLTGPKRSTT